MEFYLKSRKLSHIIMEHYTLLGQNQLKQNSCSQIEFRLGEITEAGTWARWSHLIPGQQAEIRELLVLM